MLRGFALGGFLEAAQSLTKGAMRILNNASLILSGTHQPAVQCLPDCNVMLSDPPSTYEVHQLTAISLPWLVRRRLRSVRKKHGTGTIVYGIIRTGSRNISSKLPNVSVAEGKHSLGTCSLYSHRPKWDVLTPGVHDLFFLASRSASSSAFRRRVTLSGEDVLVVICEPVQPWTFYRKSPEVDTWYLGIIDSAGEVRPAK